MEQQLAILEKDNDLKQAQIKQKNLVLFTTVSISLLLLTLIFIFYRQQRLKALQDKLLTEQRLFRSQMNPHFIFNSLASVQNFIVKQDDEKASIYLSRFSELVRSILKNSTQEQITLEEELTTIENYLELQKVRFPQKFDYSIEVDEKIDTENIFIPPMLAQPFIENSIEHGIKHKDSKGNIWVRLKLNDSKILYEVEDDGIGRKKAQEVLRKNDKDHKSMATTITLDRIKVLNKKFKKKIFMDIIDLKNDSNEATGTKVVFEIPF
jgi:LytS/YehU family sensor histidine kinase